jgi:hypothetical protein
MTNDDLDKKLREAGRRLREEAYPLALVGAGKPKRRWPRRSLAGAALVALLLALVVARPSFSPEAPRPAGPAASIGKTLLVHPPERAPIHPSGDPICAVLLAEDARSSIRVFLDETEVTSLAERYDQVILLEPPWPLPPGPHLLRLEITGDDGASLGESSWILFAL